MVQDAGYLNNSEASPKISVIVVNYNSLEHIDTCISSVLNQTYPDFEVIFVDNNSTDDSLDYARNKFPGLSFVTNTENLGYAGGVCSALSHASGQLIAPLNIDTEVAADWLSHMADYLNENPGVAAVTPKIMLFDNRGKINALGMNVHVSGMAFCRHLYEEDSGITEPQRVYAFSGCSYLIRREILEQINNSVGQWEKYYDDVIISWLINLMGYEIWCMPGAVVYHKYSLKMDRDKFATYERCRHFLVLSVLKPFTFIILLPILIVTELLVVAYSLFKGWYFIKAKIGAYGSIFQCFRSIREKRAQYEKLRKNSDFTLLKKLSWNLQWGQLFRTLD